MSLQAVPQARTGRNLATCLLLALSLVAAGCGQQAPAATGSQATPAANQPQAAPPASKPEQPAPVVRYSYLPTTNQLPAVVAQEKGFYEKHGVKVELTRVAGGAKVLEGIIAKSFDGGSTGSVPFLLAVSRGASLVGVAGNATIIKGSPTQGIVVKKDSPVQKLADLKGKILAVNTRGSLEDVLVRARVLTSQGLAEKDVTFVEIPFPQMAAMLKADKVDAIAAYEPYVTSAKKNLEVRVLSDMTEFHPASGLPVGLVAFHKDFVAAQPDAVKRFLKGYLEAVQWINDHPDEALTIASEQFKLDLALLKAMPREQLNPKGTLDLAAYKELLTWLETAKLVDKPVDLKAVTSTSFLP